MPLINQKIRQAEYAPHLFTGHAADFQPAEVDGRSSFEELKAEGARLKAEGQHLRATTKRLRLDCLKARLELAESLATIANENRACERLATLYTERARKTYFDVCAMLKHPGWTGMDDLAMQTRLEKLMGALENLKEPHEHAAPTANNAPDGLTARELEVLKCLAEGNSTKEAAWLLGITFKTTACHRYRIMQKMGVRNTSQLVRQAIRKGLIEA